MRQPGVLRTLLDALAVIGVAGRLLARHWPALLAVGLAAVLVRELVMRAAVRVSELNGELAMLILLLAPMTTLAAMVLMLRMVRPSLPWLGTSPYGPPLPVLAHLGSVLVPFMTIYYFEDTLYADIRDYNARLFEDFAEQVFAGAGEAVVSGVEQIPPVAIDERTVFDLTPALVAVVIVAIVARWLLGRWPATQRRPWLGLPGAYVELVWLVMVAVVAFQSVSELIVEWGGNRRLVHALQDVWDAGVGTATGAASPSDQAAGWVVGQLGQIQAVLIIPLSWLAIGAVVLGHQPPRVWESGAPGAEPTRLAYQRAQRRWSAAPRAIRWFTVRLTDDLRGRFLPLAQGVRMLVRAGAVPMLLFCLAFVVIRVLEDWLWQLERALIGARDVESVWIPLTWPLGELNRAITTVLLVCLLAAAVDRAMRATRPDASPPPVPAGAAPSAGPEVARGVYRVTPTGDSHSVPVVPVARGTYPVPAPRGTYPVPPPSDTSQRT